MQNRLDQTSGECRSACRRLGGPAVLGAALADQLSRARPLRHHPFADAGRPIGHRRPASLRIQLTRRPPLHNYRLTNGAGPAAKSVRRRPGPGGIDGTSAASGDKRKRRSAPRRQEERPAGAAATETERPGVESERPDVSAARGRRTARRAAPARRRKEGGSGGTAGARGGMLPQSLTHPATAFSVSLEAKPLYAMG